MGQMQSSSPLVHQGKQYCKCAYEKGRQRSIQHYQHRVCWLFVCQRNETGICSGHSEDATKKITAIVEALWNIHDLMEECTCDPS